MSEKDQFRIRYRRMIRCYQLEQKENEALLQKILDRLELKDKQKPQPSTENETPGETMIQ